MFFEKLFARQAYVKNGTGLSWLHVVGVCTFLQVCMFYKKVVSTLSKCITKNRSYFSSSVSRSSVRTTSSIYCEDALYLFILYHNVM